MTPAKAKHLVKQSKSIPGWFSPQASMLFAWIDEIQKHHKIQGDCFEIGCHHGKSAILLGSLIDPKSEKLAVCDLFGMQEGNISRSGSGDLDAFNANMASLTDVKVDIFQKNSANLQASEVGQNYRIFHVDGGHNPDEALADLQLAAECTIDSGVVVLDDPFRTEWPGVTEALIRFLDKNPDFQAIMTGFNKLLLTRSNWSSLYLKNLEDPKQRNSFGFGYPWRVKEMPFNNINIRVFYVPDYLQRKTPGNLARYVYNKSGWFSGARKNNTIKAPSTRKVQL